MTWHDGRLLPKANNRARQQQHMENVPVAVAKECTHKYGCFALGRNAPLKLSQDVLIGLFGLSGSNFRHEGCDPDPPSQ
jgi:hypothetical protein